MFSVRPKQRPVTSLLDTLLAAPLRFAVQRIENLRGASPDRFEWFFRPGLRGLSTQQVFDRLGEDERAWVLEAEIVERGLDWCRESGRPVSLNLSPSAISEPSFRHRLRSLLVARNGGPASWWEITESWPLVDPCEGRRTIDLLRSFGHAVVFDDAVGVRRLGEWVAALGEPDVVKVDQSVVQRNPEQLGALVDAIHLLGAKAVVEGIESHGAYLAARASGADYWQGYYLATPQYVVDPNQ